MLPMGLCALGIVIAVTSAITAPHKFDSALAEWSRAPTRAHKLASMIGVTLAAASAVFLAFDALLRGAP